ncbi:hypothetical protein [Aeromicrobium sp.]|uniref:hypothetical protein n=1 Tax=Aeromicrobium sp. TaxID=1871063 RepID=UPI003C666CD6
MASEDDKKTVGLFDIRFMIGGLIGIYGVILTLLGVFNATTAELDKGDGLNINLWAGLGMLAVGISFGAWARLKPLVVPDDVQEAEDKSGS